MLSTHHITLPSQLTDALLQFDPYFDRICDVYNINNTYYSTMKVALIEAIKNAIVHGNHENQHQHVQVDLEQSHGGLTFTITDEGDGFDSGNIQLSPDQSANGLFLIRTLSNEMSWKNGGRSIVITFYVSDINYEHAILRQEVLKDYFANIAEQRLQNIDYQTNKCKTLQNE